VMTEHLRLRLAALLATPDPPDLHGRGRRYVLAGDSARKDAINRDLGAAYVQRRRQEWGGQDISCVVSVRRATRPRFELRKGSRTA
jgi:hypothetical protein